jgi:hypothetical protein
MEPKTKKIIGIGITLTITGIVIYFGYKFIDKKIMEKRLRDAKTNEDKINPIINKEAPTLEPNKIAAMIGKIVYPKLTGDKYANVRSSADVNNGLINNIIGKIISPKPIGKILEVFISGDGYVWYKVATIGIKGETTGYVREENVIIK